MEETKGVWLKIGTPKSPKRKCSKCEKIVYYYGQCCDYEYCPYCANEMKPEKE